MIERIFDLPKFTKPESDIAGTKTVQCLSQMPKQISIMQECLILKEMT